MVNHEAELARYIGICSIGISNPTSLFTFEEKTLQIFNFLSSGHVFPSIRV